MRLSLPIGFPSFSTPFVSVVINWNNIHGQQVILERFHSRETKAAVREHSTTLFGQNHLGLTSIELIPHTVVVQCSSDALTSSICCKFSDWMMLLVSANVDDVGWMPVGTEPTEDFTISFASLIVIRLPLSFPLSPDCNCLRTTKMDCGDVVGSASVGAVTPSSWSTIAPCFSVSAMGVTKSSGSFLPSHLRVHQVYILKKTRHTWHGTVNTCLKSSN